MTLSTPLATSAASRWQTTLQTAFALMTGIAMTLCLRGYQFGHGNHNVYLLDALRQNNPTLLARDWFTAHTLQYHRAFNTLTAWLMRIHIVEGAFLTFYLALVALMHMAWLKLVRFLGGTNATYLLSALLFYLSGGGIGALGIYEFLQDSSVLASNIANIAMLGGICFLTGGRGFMAGVCMGAAAFFHMNHAAVAVAVWAAVLLCAWTGIFRGEWRIRGLLWGTFAMAALCLPNVLSGINAVASQRDAMPLDEFVRLYVRVRHPHHYDPSSWPAAMWVSFLWSLPLALLAYFRGTRSPEQRRCAWIFIAMCAFVGIGLLGAGVWYLNKPLIQMSLSRFSIYVKLISCVGTAQLFQEWRRASRRWRRFLPAIAGIELLAIVIAIIPLLSIPQVTAFILNNRYAIMVFALCCAAVAFFRLPERKFPRQAAFIHGGGALLLAALLMIGWNRWLGLAAFPSLDDSPDYHELCLKARELLPVDAIVMVPPNEQSFRLVAQRAIVINFKGVPQLANELPEWRDRLCAVLNMPDLSALPRRFDLTLAAIADRYAHLPADHLLNVCRQYHADYIVTGPGTQFSSSQASLVFENASWRLYHLTQ